MKYILTLITLLLTYCSHAQVQLGYFDITNTQKLNSSYPFGLTGAGKHLYFYAADTMNGYQLYETDGITPPHIVDIINPNHSIMYPVNVTVMAWLDGVLYFNADDGVHGDELWKYDGINKPQMVADLYSGAQKSLPRFFTTYEHKLVFVADMDPANSVLIFYDPVTDKISATDSLRVYSEILSSGNKLYFYGWAPGGQLPIFNYGIYSYSQKTNTVDSIYKRSYTIPFGINKDQVYFTANTGSGKESTFQLFSYMTLFKMVHQETDKNELGNTLFNISSIKTVLYKGAFYFTAQRSANSNFYLYSFNPTDASVSFIDSTCKEPGGFIVYNNKLYYSAEDYTHGRELWVYDGINAPKLVADIAPGNYSSSPEHFAIANNRLFFSATTPATGTELFYIYDSTTLINDEIHDITASLYPNPAVQNVQLKFSLKQSQTLQILLTDMNGKIVYRSDKTLYSAAEHTATIPLHNLPPGNYIYRLVNSNGKTLSKGLLTRQ